MVLKEREETPKDRAVKEMRAQIAYHKREMEAWKRELTKIQRIPPGGVGGE